MSKLFYKNKIFNQRYIAAGFKENQRKNESFVSSVTLVIKMCLFLLAAISLIKLGYSSKVRLTRLREIQESFSFEKSRFNVLTSKFDDLFTAEGQQRFMKDQDQIISRDIIRVIWRWKGWSLIILLFICLLTFFSSE